MVEFVLGVFYVVATSTFKEYLTLAFELPSFPFDNCAALLMFDSFCHSFSSTHPHARIGVTAAILYQIARKAAWLFLVLFGVVVSFAHALFLLLKDAEMVASPIALTGFLVSANAPPANISLVQTTDSATPGNAFADLPTALLSVYLFLSGDYSTVSTGYGINAPLIILKCLFIFVTAIILLNVLIALLNNVYTETAEQGEQVWLDQMAALIAEIEVYWMTPADRQNPKFFPKYIYYEASVEKSSDWSTYVQTAMSSKSDVNAQDIREVIESALAEFTVTSPGTSTPDRVTTLPNADGGSLHAIAASLGVEIERKMDERVAAMRAEIADLKELLHEVLGKKG
ncbi:hypothetical protein BC937DRAFT_91233 [Endogone sp. FLAS-F59071]|nr:hypothetical protein BC937DRAFT_91233 [Endogone sp. FLAS-F59071]|eukprot:RUS16419.1 hypothetical protein BC937DRAFT_91233 [Endogone sp. FLAS-F59071]